MNVVIKGGGPVPSPFYSQKSTPKTHNLHPEAHTHTHTSLAGILPFSFAILI